MEYVVFIVNKKITKLIDKDKPLSLNFPFSFNNIFKVKKSKNGKKLLAWSPRDRIAR